MVISRLIFLSLVIGVVFCANVKDRGNKDLRLVHIIYRHGIRTPADTYPADPHINATLLPTGWGQITNEGKLSLYEHGLYLRNRYGKFLGSYYSSDVYYVQTTDVDRAKVSAQCINAGLWPPNKEQKWGPLEWQPIPLHSEPLNSDSLLLVRKPCPEYHVELKRVTDSEEIQKLLKGNKTLFDELAQITGKNIQTFEDVQDVYTTLLSEEKYGLKLPEWTKGYYPEKMYPSTVFSFVLNVYNDKLNRLKGGVFIKKLIEDWKAIREGALKPKDRKAFLYIGHDSTIVNILSALKLWTPQVPNFSSNIFFELSYDRDAKEYGVEIFFRNEIPANTEPQQLQIPGCDYFCPIDQFAKLTENVVPQNWAEECKTDDLDFVPPPLRGP